MFDSLLSFWNNREALRAFIEHYPYLGIFLFIGLQSLQVVIAPLPGEVTGFMAGFLFGAFKGFVLSMIGIVLGSSIAFYIARTFSKKCLKNYENSDKYLKIKSIFKKHGLTGIFLLYLFPGFPKDILNYFLGFMPITFKAFIFVCTLGRAPATFALALQGDVIYQGSLQKIVLVLFLSVTVFLIYLLNRQKLQNWLETTT